MTHPEIELPIDATRSGVAFWTHVTPRARTAHVGGVHGDALRIGVRAAPVMGKANAACATAIANALGEPRTAVVVPPGSRGRRKRVEVSGDPVSLRSRLRRLASEAGVR